MTKAQSKGSGRARLADLTDVVVKKLRTRYAKGDVTMDELGVETGLSAHQVSKIVRGMVRPDAGGPIREPRSRLAAKDVEAIRKKYAKGALQVELAREHGVSISRTATPAARRSRRARSARARAS